MNDSFLIKSFRGAISDDDDKGIAGAFKFGKNLDVRKRGDTLSSGQALADDLAVGTMDSPVRFIVPASDGNTYFFLANGKIYKRTSAGSYSLVYTDTDGGINGAEEWGNNVGDMFLYWTTATKLHRKRIIGSGYTNSNWEDVDATVNSQTYPKTNLTSATWHTMKRVNGNLQIANSDTLAMVGYDDSYTNNSLQLIPGDVVKTLIESGMNAKVGANRVDLGQSCQIYVWDTMSQNYNDKMQLPFGNINAIIETEIAIVQYGTNGGLYFFGDATKLPVTMMPGGGQVAPGGIDVFEGMAIMGVYGNGTGKSGIYSYGRKFKNSDFVLNCEYQFDCDEINAVKVIGTTIIFAYKLGTTYGVKKVNSSAKAVGVYQSLDLKAPLSYQSPINFETAVLQMLPLPSGCNVEVWRRCDKVTTATPADGVSADGWYRCNTAEGHSNYDIATGTEATFLIGDKGKILELQVVLNPSTNYTPEVLQIQVPFSS